MISRELKLKLTKAQEKTCNEWLWNLTGVYNWAIRKIELDAKDKIYFTNFKLHNLTSGNAKKIGLPAQTFNSIINQAYVAWKCCFRKISSKPKLKSNRRKLNSIPFPSPENIQGLKSNKIKLLKLSWLKFHKQDIPAGKIKQARIIKRATGWFLVLFIDTERELIICNSKSKVGIDPGFKDLLTLSNGIKIPRPKEVSLSAKRLAQSQRGNNKKLTARLQRYVANQKRDRNHKLSLWLCKNYKEIYFSKDNISGIAKKFGKSVNNSNHYQLRKMIEYKISRTDGSLFKEVESKNSTQTCSTCGSINGPKGLIGLKVRSWTCKDCGSVHDRDINAAMNTLNFGLGLSHENSSDTVSETIVI